LSSSCISCFNEAEWLCASQKEKREGSALETTKRCPFCAEQILAAAIKCKHCGSDLAQVAPAAPPPTPDPPRTRVFFKVLGVLLVLGLLVTLLNHKSDEKIAPTPAVSTSPNPLPAAAATDPKPEPPAADASVTSEPTPDYIPTTIREFVIDGPQLAADSARLNLSGVYVLEGRVGYLYTNHHSVELAHSVYEPTTQPRVAVLTDDASRELRAKLLSCQTDPVSAQTGCTVSIRGNATVCGVSNGFGATHDEPCLNAMDEILAPEQQADNSTSVRTEPVSEQLQPGGGQSVPVADASSPEVKVKRLVLHEAPVTVDPPVAAPVEDTELDRVRRSDAAAANRIAAFCSRRASAGDQAACTTQEVAAWSRLVVHSEFGTLDPTTVHECTSPPFQGNFVGEEACVRYKLTHHN
jgi:hypothetical protein